MHVTIFEFALILSVFIINRGLTCPVMEFRFFHPSLEVWSVVYFIANYPLAIHKPLLYA